MSDWTASDWLLLVLLILAAVPVTYGIERELSAFFPWLRRGVRGWRARR